MKRLLYTFFFFIYTFLMFSCSGGGSNDLPSRDNNGSSFGEIFIGIYMVGSDLESGDNAGTTDLLELVEGYNSLSDAEKSNVYVYVAFGGANKDGWRGVKYADINCLIKDSTDKKFGNDACYEYTQTISTQNLKNMSHKEAFGHFLNKIKSKSANFNTKILVMWDHGGAYEGVGWDENWQNDGTTLDKNFDDLSNNDNLTIYEIRDTLKSSNINFDIIGFDACLMANLEVAIAIKDYGKYLIASEESEPNHGWDYKDLIQKLAKNSLKPLVDKAKLFVDSFVDNPNHEKGSGLTLSVIDLSKVDNLKQKLDSIDFTNLDLNKIVLAEKVSQKFGFSIDANLNQDYYTIDIGQFADKAGLTDLKNEISNVVVYSKDDGSVISSGISMASFSKIIEFILNKNTKLKDENILPINYFTRLENLSNQVSTDKTKPQVSSQNCVRLNTQGICYTITDNLAVDKVGIFTLIYSQNSNVFYLSSYDYVPKTGNNEYFVDKNKYYKVILFCNGDCQNSNSKVYAPVYFLYQTPDNKLVYISPAKAPIQVNGKSIELDGFLILKFDPAQGSFKVYFTDSPTSKIRLSIGEDITSLKFIYLVIDAQGNASTTTSQEISFSNGIDLEEVSLQGSNVPVLLILTATDVAENEEIVNIP